MNVKIHDVSDCVVVVIDLQTNMMPAIQEGQKVAERAAYLVECAKLLGVPVLSTEQIPAKLGPTVPEVAIALEGADPSTPKNTFSCCPSLDFMDALRGTWRKQVVLCGVETHICVLQTAIDLRDQSFDVTICEDAVGSRDQIRKDSGLNRARQGGCQIAHSESIVYEWVGNAQNPAFKQVLEATKKAPL